MVYAQAMRTDPNAPAIRAFAYFRVSTDEQAASGNGLDAQAAAVTRAIEARGWQFVTSFTDGGRSGGNMDRPELTKALDHLDRGVADVLVVAKLDRLSRSVSDFDTIARRAKRHHWSVVALDVDVDTTTPAGELMANIYGAVAQWERRIIGVRTSEAMRAMKARGVRLGRPVDLPDDVRRRIAAEHEAGRSLRAIAEALNDEAVPTAQGGARWYASTVRDVLGSLALDAEAEAVIA